jgi:ABC-type nitrate/sulfonate/bicarbonate transport system ATPase subunit
MTLPVISVRGLRTVFGDHVVHDRLDLDVTPGEILSLVGGSGSGKTALLRQIIGLNRPARRAHDAPLALRAVPPRGNERLGRPGALISPPC